MVIDALHVAAAVDEDRFVAYGTAHLLALALLVVGAVALVVLGRSTAGSDPGDRTGKVLAAVNLAMTLPLQVLYFMPGSWDLQKTLPLQLCDVASAVSIYALWTHASWACALTYYWGLTLTTQAILTPDLAAVFPQPVFLLYWGMHLMIVWAAAYLTWGRGVRPDWRSYRTAVALTVVWAAAIFAFNLAMRTNYGYLMAKPAAASALDLFGPWPQYLLVEALIVVTVWAAMTWPWTRAGTGVDRPDRDADRSASTGSLSRGPIDLRVSEGGLEPPRPNTGTSTSS